MESDLYEGWVDAGYFKADRDQRQAPVLDRAAAAERDRQPAHGPRARPHADGRADPAQAHAGLRGAVAARHGPRRHRHPDAWWRSSSPSTARPKRTSAASCSSTRCGTGSTTPAAPSAAQMRRLGDGVDWSRDRFTMDDGLSRAVRTIFKRLFDAGLIYRAERLVNWSPVLETAISDLEVKYEDVEGELVSFRYGSLRRRRTAHRGGHHPGRDDARRHRDRGAPRRRALPRPGRHRRCRTRSSTASIDHRRRRARRPRVRHRRSQSHPRARPERLRDRPAAPAADADDHGHQGPDRRHRNRIRRHGPLRGAGQGARGAGRAGPHRRGEAALPAQRRALRAQRRADRAAAVPAVVGQGRVAGQGRRRRGSQRRHRDSPAQPGTALVRLGRQHARLVHLAPAVVGPPHPDLARPRRRDGVRRPRRDPARGLGAGPRRARHLVLLGAVAVLHDGLARAHRRTGEVLSDHAFWSPATTSCSSGWPG